MCSCGVGKPSAMSAPNQPIDSDEESDNSDVECEAIRTPRRGPALRRPVEQRQLHAKTRTKSIRDDLLSIIDEDIKKDSVTADKKLSSARAGSCESDASSASSAQVEQVVKRNRKDSRRHVTHNVPTPELSQDETDMMLMEQARDRIPTVAPIGDLLRLYPHMRTSQTRPSAVTTADGKVIIPPPSLDQERPNPPISDILQNHLMNVVRPHYSMPGVSHHDIIERLRNREALLPLLTADFESVLLAEAGTFPVRMQSGRVDSFDFPACCRGDKCVGMTYSLHGFTAECPGVVLTALMMPTEYKLFMETHTAPQQKRCCILCARAHLVSFILTLRANQERLPLVDRSFSCQLYRSTYDVPGGYNLSCMLIPAADCYEGLFDPVVGFFHSKLRAVRDPRQNLRWVIDQSAMVYKHRPPLVPNVAEPIKVVACASSSSQMQQD